MKANCFWLFSVLIVSGCIHPKVGLRKSRLLDPMMDVVAPAQVGEIAIGTVQANFERAISAGGAVSGGSCPTCK
jgi:hypothetical protein